MSGSVSWGGFNPISDVDEEEGSACGALEMVHIHVQGLDMELREAAEEDGFDGIVDQTLAQLWGEAMDGALDWHA